jgi:NAD(P)-dependent dehydrogenase (short-subunit alcohol dehydrogenase family)
MTRLAGKRALVWGGGSGIGFACADAMSVEGAQVFIASRRAERLAAAAQRLSRDGRRAGWAAGDATQAADVRRATAAAVEFLGGLDTLVISSGTSAAGAIYNMTLSDFTTVVDGNLLPLFLATRHAVDHLITEGNASVIAIASMYGLVGKDARVAYCTAKAGQIGMVRAMALDLADRGVRVNAICPGFVETELALSIIAGSPDPEQLLAERRASHPIPRSGRPEEIGAAAVYLASDAAAFVTGQCLTIDGGYVTR